MGVRINHKVLRRFAPFPESDLSGLVGSKSGQKGVVEVVIGVSENAVEGKDHWRVRNNGGIDGIVDGGVREERREKRSGGMEDKEDMEVR